MDWAIDILAEMGFLYDSSMNPMSTYLFGEKGLPRHPYRLRNQPPLWEIPPAAISLLGGKYSVGGGFFLRALPLAYQRWAIGRYNREDYPAVVYIHPWELDPDHPEPELPWKEKIIHKFGLPGTIPKIDKLLSKSTSVTLKDYIHRG